MKRGPRKADLGRLRKMAAELERDEARLQKLYGDAPKLNSLRTTRIRDLAALRRVLEWFDAATARPR